MDINLLISEPSMANSKLDNKGVNVLTIDGDDAFQKILKYSENEQISTAENSPFLDGTKFGKGEGLLLNYHGKIDSDALATLSAKGLLTDAQLAENLKSITDVKVNHGIGKDKLESLFDTKIKVDGDLSDLKSGKNLTNNHKLSHIEEALAAKSLSSEAELKRSAGLNAEKQLTEQPLESLNKFDADKSKLASEKKSVSIADTSTIEQDTKLIKSISGSESKTNDVQLEPKLPSAVEENNLLNASVKSKLKEDNIENQALSDTAELKLKPALSTSASTAKLNAMSTEHDAKLISKLKAKEAEKAEKASDEEYESRLSNKLDVTALTMSAVLSEPELATSTGVNMPTSTQSDSKSISASEATLLESAKLGAITEKESSTTADNMIDKSDAKLTSQLDKNSADATTKLVIKKPEQNLTPAADPASTAAAVSISKSTEITNAALQTIQSEKQNGEMNLTTAPTNHAVNQSNMPNQQQVSTPTVTLPLPINNPQWQDSLSQQIVVFNRQDIQKAEIRLHPEELGSLHIKLEMNDGKMQLQMASAHAAVRGILESAIPHLRTSLAEQGIDLQQTDISHSSMSDNANQQSMFSQQRKGSPAQTQLMQQEDLDVIDNNMLTGGTKHSGLSVFA